MSEWHAKGDVVKGKFCPKCRGGRLVYNGNYFCERFGEGCDWAMGEQNSPYNRDIILTYLLQCREDALAEGNAERADRMDHHIISLEKYGV